MEVNMVRMKRAFFAGTIFLSSMMCASQARAKNIVISDVHGSDLLRFCTSEVDPNESQFCYAFILGIRDGAALATELRGVKPIFEIPLEVGQEQLKDVVVKYLRDHP
jgi:Rap1a immunity proteins